MPAAPNAFLGIERRFRGAIAAAVRLDPACFDRPGTSIVSSPDRKGWRTASGYEIGDHTLIWCDPDVVDRVETLGSDTVSFSIEKMEAWAGANDAEFLGGAWSHLIDSSRLDERMPPEGSELMRLDRDYADDRALIGALVEASDPDDLDAAEIELDALDHLIVSLTDAEGRLAAFASERPWENDAVFGDIGVLVRSDQRRGGWGRAVVTALCRESFARDRLPLYRCNWDRDASRRLALSVGFRQVTSLTAVRFKPGQDHGG